MKKPTPRARRLKKHREFAEIYVKVAKGELRITEELMRSITSPKWKIKIAQVAITVRITGPLQGYYKPGRGGTLYNYEDHENYMVRQNRHYKYRRGVAAYNKNLYDSQQKLDKLKKQEQAVVIAYTGAIATLMFSGFWSFSTPIMVGAVIGIIGDNVLWKLRQWITKDNENI